ncbi:plasmid pRiA4b ORF-3 family protein [Aneurinibacillus aneurinilyticus]|uniref:plasmid pRiA4b ORF-3 family protein n=1 Tax=Aneurinibacillus aneurinilyticus TaxID=1391 RepID=UPI0023F23EB0|nr:plasmid pRiA4b ORF-3 family protein [Aneurinibacillus aneurinilyticus]
MLNAQSLEIERMTLFVRDFQTFIDYVRTHPVTLTKAKEQLMKKDLHTLNQHMHYTSDTSEHAQQQSYPLLHLFYHLALAGSLLEKSIGERGSRILRPTERLALYEQLTETEKYFFLLETLWIDTHWDELRMTSHEEDKPVYTTPFALEFISRQQARQKVQIVRRNYICELDILFSSLNYFALYFAYFGFWDVTQDQEEMKRRGSKRVFQVETVTPTALGIALSSILCKERLLPAWNVANRRENGDGTGLPGAPLADGHEYMEGREYFRSSLSSLFKEIEHMDDGKQNRSGEAFFKPFMSLFSHGELQNTLSPVKGREPKVPMDGVYTVKVSLTGRVWRKISLSSKHTLDDLHLAIQQAFEFSNDHLYSFFMDNKPWSKQRIPSPQEEGETFLASGGPFAHQLQLRDADLYEGKAFLYLFDYGDEWLFKVVVESIDTESVVPLRPIVVETKGAAPEQYGW